MKKLTPLKAIRQKVLDLNCGDKKAIRVGSIESPMDVPVVFHAYRFGRKPTEVEAQRYGPESRYGPLLSPLKAIKAYCRDCSGGSTSEVKACPCTDCPLYLYRKGKNPAKRRADARPPGGRPFVKTRGQSSALPTSKPQDIQKAVIISEEEKP